MVSKFEISAEFNSASAFLEFKDGEKWIGLYISDDYRTWGWVDGTNLTFAQWAEGYPREGGEKCVNFYHEFKNDIDCFEAKLPGVCKKAVTEVTPAPSELPTIVPTSRPSIPTTLEYFTSTPESPTQATTPSEAPFPSTPTSTSQNTTPTSAQVKTTTSESEPATSNPPSQGPCPPNWSYFEPSSSCFTLTDTKMNWLNASNWCNIRGTEMASIHSQAELDFTKSNHFLISC